MNYGGRWFDSNLGKTIQEVCMSRKYCRVCGESHQNGGQGTCDNCEAKEKEESRVTRNENVDKLNEFLALSEEDKWMAVFKALTSRGWELYE